jgi:malonyl CoA-acyl carrier protein transacylase
MDDEKDVAEAAVQLVKQLALACASLIVGREKGLLSDANLDVARLNEWVDSFATDNPTARKMFNAFLRSEVERLRRETLGQ